MLTPPPTDDEKNEALGNPVEPELPGCDSCTLADLDACSVAPPCNDPPLPSHQWKGVTVRPAGRSYSGPLGNQGQTWKNTSVV